MEDKHTPGPWAQEATLSSDFDYIRYITADGLEIAKVRHRKDQTQEEALANAHLMKAAPDMLEAIEAHLNPLVDRQKAHDMRRAAIAKARGA